MKIEFENASKQNKAQRFFRRAFRKFSKKSRLFRRVTIIVAAVLAVSILVSLIMLPDKGLIFTGSWVTLVCGIGGGLFFVLALVRGFGSGLVHGICTVMVGWGISYIKKRRKLFYCGTFALLSTAIIYHATYNLLVQSKYQYIGVLLPILTYIPLLLIVRPKLKKRKIALSADSNKSE